MENKSSLRNMLSGILANANKEQNQHYPPFIFDAHYNAVTSFLLTALADSYPRKQSIVDVAEPFLRAKRIPVRDGIAVLPDYRNFLSASVRVAEQDPDKCKTAKAIPFRTIVNGKNRKQSPVRIVDQTEFDDLTRHEYKAPTLEDPIGCFLGKRELTIFPLDIYAIEFRYLVNENIYRYGYVMQPDDTYAYDASSTIETQWNSNAFNYLYSGINHLYSVYARDNEMREWSIELKKLGLI